MRGGAVVLLASGCTHHKLLILWVRAVRRSRHAKHAKCRVGFRTAFKLGRTDGNLWLDYSFSYEFKH